MKFYDREKEINTLCKICKRGGFRVAVVTGRRRIGKTRLILEFLNGKNFEYIFVPAYKTKEMFLEELSGNGNLPGFRTVADLFRYLFETREYIFLDEFQNFYDMDKSIYSDVQKLVDEFRYREKKCCVLISGSSYSLMNRIFVDSAHPLYGRADTIMSLGPLGLKTVREILTDAGIKDPEEHVRYYSVFGGVPKYYELLEGSGSGAFRDAAKGLFFDRHMPLLKDEGRNVLVTEFGGEYKTYFTILEAIALGKNTVSEINSALEGGSNASRYLDILRKDYNVIVRETPILEDPRQSRRGIYAIRDPFLRFWFRFIKRYDAYFEQGRTEELYGIFSRDFDTFTGFAFERIVEEFLTTNRQVLPFNFERIGRQWGLIKGAPRGKNAYEIDLLAVDRDMTEVLLMECKWQELREKEVRELTRSLEKKTEYLELKDGTRYHYGIFARKIHGKTELRKEGLFVLDMDDMSATSL